MRGGAVRGGGMRGVGRGRGDRVGRLSVREDLMRALGESALGLRA
jgi:hypothetical protein